MEKYKSKMIVRDPKVMGGVAVLAGTRLPVYVVLEQLQAGHGIEDILRDYPNLTREKIEAAIGFAAELAGAA